MELTGVTDIIVSLIKECNFKINEFNNHVEEHHNFLEELYLEACSKLTAPSSAGMIILPKTPAPKRGRKAKNIKKEEEAEKEKENVNDTDEQQASPVFSRSGRAASKAATVKIKESQRMLNDLSSKRRRPDDSQDKEQMLGSSAEFDAASSKRNRYAGKDSGISDTSCSRTSIASSRGRPSKTHQRLRLQELLQTEEEDNKQEDDDECQPQEQEQLNEQEEHKELKPDVQSDCDNHGVKSAEKVASYDSEVENAEEMVKDKEDHNKSIESRRSYYSPQPDIKCQQKQQVVETVHNNSFPHKNINASVDGNIPNSPVIIDTKDKLNTSSIESNSVPISDSPIVPKDVDTEGMCSSSTLPTTSAVPPAAQFAVPLDPSSNKVPCESNTRSTRTKTRYVADVDQHVADETDRPVRTTRTKKRQAGQDSLHQPEVVATAGRTTRTKKRKMEEDQQDLLPKPVEDVVCLVLSESEDEFNTHDTSGRASNVSVASTVSIASTTRAGASSKTVKNDVLQGNQRYKDCSVVNEERRNGSSIVSGNAIVVISKLSPVILAKAVGATAFNKNKVTVKASPPQSSVQILCQESPEHFNVSNESEKENDDDEEEVSLVQPFRRITRSKVRQQQQPLPVPVNPKVTAALKKTATTTAGKFSPRPFGNRVGVKQLAAAYSEHVAGATTPAKNDRPRPLQRRPSSLSRVPMNVSRVTPSSCSRVRPGMLSSASSDSHHYRNGTKVFTPSQVRRPANLVTGMKSFLSSGVAVQPPRLTREEVEEQRLEEIRRKREREEEICRNKEERIRSKGIQAKRRNEERQRKVQEARAASVRRAAVEADRKAAELAERKAAELAERKAAELAERKAAELAERLDVEKRTRDERIKQEALRKKKREEEEKRRRQEEEARKRKEEAEEKRRVEAERREFLRQQEEEQRLLKERKAEEEKRVQEDKQRREAERLAREKEELRLLKEKEAARLLAAQQQQQQKQQEQKAKLAHPLNVTFDANKTYTTAAKAAPKTPMNPAVTRQDSYEMTPAQDEDANNYCIDDLRSDDSSDDDTNPKKKVPLWATRAELCRALVNQEYRPPQLDVIFPAVLLLLVPDLTVMFKLQRARFKVRSSSAQWKTPPHKVFSNIK